MAHVTKLGLRRAGGCAGVLILLIALPGCPPAGPQATPTPPASVTPEPTAAPTFTATAAPSATAVSTASASPTPSASASASPTGEASATPSPSATATPTATAVPGTPIPSGAVTVYTLGDSLTEGDGDESGRGGYPPRLIEMIQAVRPGSSVTNVGHSGWTSRDVIFGGPLDEAVAARPTIACVLIGSNDLWGLYEYGPPEGTGDALEAEDLANYTDNIDTILRRLTDAGVRVFIGLVDDQSLRPVAADDAMRSAALPGTSEEEVGRMSRQAVRYNDVIRAKAAEYGATTVDFFSTTIFTNPATLSDDGNHPNAAGYDAIAGVWFDAIGPRL